MELLALVDTQKLCFNALKISLLLELIATRLLLNALESGWHHLAIDSKLHTAFLMRFQMLSLNWALRKLMAPSLTSESHQSNLMRPIEVSRIHKMHLLICVWIAVVESQPLKFSIHMNQESSFISCVPTVKRSSQPESLKTSLKLAQRRH